jgi:hypothetical protein
MNVATRIVENGQIRLPQDVRVPERTKVFVVVPGVPQPSVVRLRSPRLARPQQNEDFKKTIVPNPST